MFVKFLQADCFISVKMFNGDRNVADGFGLFVIDASV